MSNLEVKPISNDKKAVKKFVVFSEQVYKNKYENWVAPIFFDQVKLIRSGPFNEIGEKQLFMAYRDGKPVARVSAHISHAHNDYYKTKQGFFGFFEALDDEEAVKVLFDEAAKWLKDKGCDSIIGPMNFSIYDQIGTLVNNFEDLPVIDCPYNPPYYPELLEKVGFAKEVDWFAFYKNGHDPIPDFMQRVAQRIDRNSKVNIRPVVKKRWEEEVATVKHIFNQAWSENWGHVPFTDEQWHHIVQEMKLIIEEKLAFIVEVEGEPVGFSVSLPDVNYALQKARGRLLPFGIFKILLNKNKTKKGTVKRIRTVIMGVLDQYRRRGYDMYLIKKTIDNGLAMGYDGSDCSLIVENNTRMIEGLDAIGAKNYKTYRIYKKPI